MNNTVSAILSSYFNPDQETLRNPHPAYTTLREHADVHRVDHDGNQTWVVTGYETAKQVLTDPRFSNDPVHRADDPYPADGPRTMLMSDAPQHTRLRKVIAKHFTPGATAARRRRIQAIVDELLAGVDGTCRFDSEIAGPLAARVVLDILGASPDDQHKLVPRLVELSDVAGAGNDAAELIESLRQDIVGVITDGNHVAGDNILSTLHHARSSGELSHEDMMATGFLIISAGHETTVNLIVDAVHSLLTHPKQLAKLRAEPGLLPGAIEEVLRFESATAHSSARWTTEQVTVSGVNIPAGSLVRVNLNAVNRDEACVAQPQQFLVNREPSPHLAFGYKRHICLGASLARLEAEIALSTLLSTFSDIRLDIPAEDVEWRTHMALRGPRHYPLVLTRG